jgi:VWFA-related protein
MDGLYVALTDTLAESERSLVVLFTDGSDTTSWLRPADVAEGARRSNAVIYAVTMATSRRAAALEELTRDTGGDLLRVESNADLRGAFERILREFRSRYILAYTPTGVAAGGFHKLDVRVSRRGATVRARPGYIGG